jgi:c-di-GMP-binding flagellar brake protein YcgR
MKAATSMEVPEKAEELAAGQPSHRATPRVEVDEDARLLVVNHGSALPCHVIDLSLNGCRVRTQERIPAGILVRVEVSFKVRGLAFRFCGLTQWTNGRNLAGIRFVDVPARRREELAEALGEVQEANAAKAAKQAAEERAAALKAAATPVVEQSEEKGPRQSTLQAPAQTITARFVPLPRVLAAYPLAGPLLQAPQAGRAVVSLSGSPVSPVSAIFRFAELCPSALPPTRATLGVPHALEAQKTEAPPAAVPLPKPAQRERRTQYREEVDTSVVIQLINIASRLQGRILDLSLNGCRIHTDERFPVGIYTRVETEFLLEGLPFRLGGVIQTIQDRERRNVGIRFLDMSSRKREQIEQLMEEIKEQRERETEGTGNRQ